MLTARGQVVDKVVGLKLGADDYVTKPFEMAELLARIEAHLRRVPANPHPAEGCAFGDVRVDFRKAEAIRDGQAIELSAREYQMLELFMRNAGNVLSREQLLSHVWGYDYDPGSNVVDVYVGYLRKKLGADAVATVRGMGYRMPRTLA